MFSPVKVYLVTSTTSAFSDLKPDIRNDWRRISDSISQDLPIVYKNFRTLSNHTSRYIRKCIRFIYSFYPITLKDRWGTTEDFAIIPFHPILFSSPSRADKVHPYPLTLSSQPFFCLPLLLFHFTLPSRIVFAKPEDLRRGQSSWPGSGAHHILQGLLRFSANLLYGFTILVQHVQQYINRGLNSLSPYIRIKYHIYCYTFANSVVKTRGQWGSESMSIPNTIELQWLEHLWD